MNTVPDRDLTLKLPSLASFLPVAVQYVETAAGAFGLGREEALKLSLATEEIFVYLCEEMCRGEYLEIECHNGLYYTRVRFHFTVSSLNLGGLNITSTVAGDGESGLKGIGLMLASRSVDRLHIVAGKQNRISLSLEKEKAYPATPGNGALAPPESGQDLRLITPDTEGLKEFAARAVQMCPDSLRPLFFNYPGMVADMVAGGDYQAIAAVSSRGEIAGGLLFCFRTDRIVQMYGPYVFTPSREAETAQMLLDACISRLVRTRAVALTSLTGMHPSLEGHFESLGMLSYYPESGRALRQPSLYRLLHEDPGCAVWTHADLRAYLEREYGRLVLAREIRLVRDLGETRAGESIFSAELKPERSEVVLRPLWPGADMAANVERHTRFLRKDGVRNLYFELDLGVPWHAALIPALLAGGFRAEIILPFAGQADLVMFQFHALEG